MKTPMMLLWKIRICLRCHLFERSGGNAPALRCPCLTGLRGRRRKESKVFGWSRSRIPNNTRSRIFCPTPTPEVTGPQPGTGKPGNCHPRNFCKHDAIRVFHMKSYFLRLRYLYVNFFSRQLCRIRAASYWTKLLTSQCTMLPKTPNTEPETRR